MGNLFIGVSCLVFALALMPGQALGVEPGEVLNLQLGADKQTLSWDAEVSAEDYNVYRAYIHELSPEFLGVWLETEISGTSHVDTMKPFPGFGFFYLVTASNTDGQGTMGESFDGASGNPRPNNFAWPGADVAGKWHGLRSWPVWAIHSVMLHTGKVLSWEGVSSGAPSTDTTTA